MFVVSLLSCTKDEGVGGNTTIRGKVIVRDYNDDYSILLEDWGEDCVLSCCRADINCDGQVNAWDYAVFQYEEGRENCPACTPPCE